MTRWQRFWDWWFGEREDAATDEPTGAYRYWTTFKYGVETKPITNMSVTLTQHPPNPQTWVAIATDRPTTEELADLLEQLTLEGMPPRAQAAHAAFHWPGMVRKEAEPDVSE